MTRASQIAIIVAVLLAFILGVVSLGLNTLIGVSGTNDLLGCIVAFNIIAVLVCIGAAIVYILLIIGVGPLKILKIVGFVFVVVVLLSFIISAGCATSVISDNFGSWLLSALWVAVIATAVAIFYTFFNENTD